MTLVPERARAQDLGPALALLREAELPTEGVAEQFGHYFVVRDDGRLVGLAGLEVHSSDGLLRSVVVESSYRRQGLARGLVDAVLGLASRLDLDGVYLLTTTAHDAFARLGFADVSREAAPGAIRDSWEFRNGCPASAAFMHRAARVA